MRRVVIYPYKMESNSARTMANELEGIMVYPDRKYRPRPDDLVINWGNSHAPNWVWPDNGFNSPTFVGTAANKLSAFITMRNSQVSTPAFTDSYSEALSWGIPVMGRAKLTGTRGDGCEYAEDCSELPQDLPLYVEYIKKQAEFRIHVFNGEVIDVQKKIRCAELESENADYQIRTWERGWNFARNGVDPPALVQQAAIAGLNAVQLDFGAVDVIWNEKMNSAYVLEVNTAPGLEGTTINTYINQFNSILRGE
jgi:hypothetical protein